MIDLSVVADSATLHFFLRCPWYLFHCECRCIFAWDVWWKL